jgi:16S rRNA processing protein RimM
MASAEDRLVVLGRIAGVFGVRGELKVESYTEPREGICAYQPWLLEQHGVTSERRVAHGRRHGNGVVVTLEGVADRDQALALRGASVAVRRSQLPPPAPGQYYWYDLEGLRVETVEGVSLGEVSHLFGTGANDVLVVRGDRERLLPYVPAVVREVDLAAGRIRVDWDPEF